MAPRSKRRGLTNGLSREAHRGAGRTNGLGRTNGIVNGLGRTNGLVNGTRGRTNGIANGPGRTNGLTNGLTNGTRTGGGFVNGSGFVNGLSLRRNPFGVVTHRDLRRGIALILASVLAVPLLGYFLSAPAGQGSSFAIDGDFTEWASVPTYRDPGNGFLPAFGLHAAYGKLYVYGDATGALFRGPTPTSAFVLLSRTDLPTPGYAAAPGFRANAVAELFGWDGSLRGTDLRVWPDSPAPADPDNKSALESKGGFPAVAAATLTEVQFELALDLESLGWSTTQVRVRLAISTDSATGFGAAATPGLPALFVNQSSSIDTISGTGTALTLKLRALAGDVRVDFIDFEGTGGGTHSVPTFPFTVAAGTSRTEDITVSAGSLPNGTLLTLRATEVTAATPAGGPVPATMEGDGARFYVGSVPAGKTIDGVFSDWTNVLPDGSDLVPTSIDLRGTAFSLPSPPSDAYFYVRTQGQVLAGAVLPVLHETHAPTGNASAPTPPVPIGRVAGEDVLRVYVDTDDRDGIGYPFDGILADRLVEIRGRLGGITAKELYAWNDTARRWVSQTASPAVAFVGAQLEASAPLAFLGPTHGPRVVFATSDWSGALDRSERDGVRGTRGEASVEPLHLPSAKTIVATPLANVPTVDGNCQSSSGEYDGASSDSTGSLLFWIGRRSDSQFVFVCIQVTADGTQNPFDWGEVLFDTAHDGMGAPQTDDRRFRVNSGSDILSKDMGTGTDWTACDNSCDSGDNGAGAFTGGVEVYEFQIRFSDVWGRNDPSADQRAGFAIVANDQDANQAYSWGSDFTDENVPNSWGHLDIPESPLAAAAVAILALPLLGRHRRRGRQV